MCIRYLINAATITQDAVDAVTWWHLELHRHDVVLAENMPAESYLDTGNRAAFADPDAAAADADLARAVWHGEACAALVHDGPTLTAIRAALLERAGTLGYRQTDEPSLRVVLPDGRSISAEVSGSRHRFVLPPDATAIRLASRSAVPAHVLAANADHRRLGVAIAALAIAGRPLPLSDPALGAGWHALEDEGWRWTAGDAHVALACSGSLDIYVAMAARSWQPETT